MAKGKWPRTFSGTTICISIQNLMLTKTNMLLPVTELYHKPDMKSCSDFERTMFQLLFIHSAPMASDIPLSLWGGDSSSTESDLLLDLGDRLLQEQDDEDEGSSSDRRRFFITVTGSIVFEPIR